MKRTLIGLLLCATGLGLSAQDNSKEIIKQGWNFGPLPVVGWDSDLGFQYGACVDIFNYGDGTNYPSYNYKMNLEASTYTGGSSLLRCYGDFKTLIPDGKCSLIAPTSMPRSLTSMVSMGMHRPICQT